MDLRQQPSRPNGAQRPASDAASRQTQPRSAGEAPGASSQCGVPPLEFADAAPAAPSQPVPLPPQPEPAFRDAAPDGASARPRPAQPERHHVHHSYIWLGALQMGGVIFLGILLSAGGSLVGNLFRGNGLFGGESPFFTILITAVATLAALVLVVGLTLLYQWLSYKHLYYEFGDEEFSLYSGIFNKKRVHVPYGRVQSVDQHASLLQRVFGVCSVSIDTAGGAANKAVTVPYVRKDQAEWLRVQLYARKQLLIEGASSSGIAAAPDPSMRLAEPIAPPSGAGVGNVLDAPAEIWQDVRGVFGGEAVDLGRVSYEHGLSNKELLFTGLSNGTGFVLIVVGLVGVVAQIGELFFDGVVGSEQALLGQVQTFGSVLFGGNLAAVGIAFAVMFVLVLYLVSAAGTCISFGGFKARRRGSRVEVERGLLQHRVQGVDVDRVQSVIVKQGVIRRLLGYCELSLGKIDAMPGGEAQQSGQQAGMQQGMVIHPFVKLSRVPEILAGIIPEFADVPVENASLPPVALRRGIIRRSILQGSGFWLAVAVASAQALINLLWHPTGAFATGALASLNAGAFVAYVLCAVLFALDVVGAVLWFRGSGFAYNRRFMQISNGGLARETVSFPRGKIQFGCVKTNPFQRHARTATVCVRTAAGVSGTTVRLIDVREEDAGAWLAWLKPGGNVVS